MRSFSNSINEEYQGKSVTVNVPLTLNERICQEIIRSAIDKLGREYVDKVGHIDIIERVAKSYFYSLKRISIEAWWDQYGYESIEEISDEM